MIGQFVPASSLFSIAVPGQQLNLEVLHETVVFVTDWSVSSVGGLQLVPSLFLFFVLVPGQHPKAFRKHTSMAVREPQVAPV